MRCSIRKNINTRGFKYKVKVMTFKDATLMHNFLNKQHDNAWSIMDEPITGGTYIERGIPPELINIKHIDASALAHM